jgi:hypothetical protein
LRQAASLLVLAGVPLAGPGSGEDDPPASEYNLTALRLSTEGLQLDGQLNELVWLTAEPITGFMQRDPDEGEPASERTEVRVFAPTTVSPTASWAASRGETPGRRPIGSL